MPRTQQSNEPKHTQNNGQHANGLFLRKVRRLCMDIFLARDNPLQWCEKAPDSSPRLSCFLYSRSANGNCFNPETGSRTVSTWSAYYRNDHHSNDRSRGGCNRTADIPN